MESLRRFCIDTDVLVDYLRNTSGEARRVMEKVYDNNLSACTTTVNAFEIWLGANLAPKNTCIIEDTRGFLSQLEILDFDYESSVEAGRVLAELRKKGIPIEIRDLFVGSTCKTAGIPLITRNLKHYSRINDLQIMTPQQALEKLE